MKSEKLDDVLEKLKEAQEVDSDNRQMVRESHLFIDKPDGQWEPFWWLANKDKPRYTFDMTGPIVDQIAGEIEQADFDVRVKPAGGDASKEIAKIYDGLVRNIENISDAQNVFSTAARNMVTGGVDGWRVVQKYVDDDSFDQDLVIERIPNFVDRVWFDPTAAEPDMSDAKCCWVLQTISKEEYKERWPEGSEQSISDDRSADAYDHKKDGVIIGQYYYVKDEERTLYLMSDGRVLEDSEEFESVRDELAAKGVVVEQERKRKKRCVYSRLFDNSDWLTPPQKTVFQWIPVIPVFGNFKVIEDKVIYRGVVQKLMDAQRVFNYSLSREVEEGALAPRAKYWMTQKQAEGHEAELSTLNTNMDPVQFYNADAEAPGRPDQIGGAQINPGLRNISESMRAQFNYSSGMFAANMGDNPGLQSGVAIKQLQDKGNIGTSKFFAALEVAIRHTGRIIVNAIPKVYDSKREVRILGEDGAFSMKKLNDFEFDEQTGEYVKVNDLSKGVYDVTCDSGPAFQNKQQETVQAIIEAAQVNPAIMELGGDILLNNISAPGMDLLAERLRSQLFQAGVIPQDQWTEEEMQQMQAAAAQPKEPDAATLLAQAEMVKAQNEQAKTQVSVQEKAAKIQLDSQKAQLDQAKFQHSVMSDQAKFGQVERSTTFDQQMQMRQFMKDMQDAVAQQNMMVVEALNKQADTLNKLREAQGIDAVMSEEGAEIYSDQLEIIDSTQDDV